MDQGVISFIGTLLKDIRRYKTLPTNTLRKLILPENGGEKSYEELIENIKLLRRKLGDDYLKIVLERTQGISDDIIIAIENRKEQ